MDEALKQDKHEISVINIIGDWKLLKIMKPKKPKLLEQLLDSGNSAVDRRTVIQRIKMIDYFEKGQTSQ